MASWTQLSAFSSVLADRRLMVEVFVVLKCMLQL